MKRKKIKKLKALVMAAHARLDEIETAVYGLPQEEAEFHPDFLEELLGERSKGN